MSVITALCSEQLCTIPASVSDRAHILAIDRQSVYKTFLEDDQVGIICGHVG